MPKGEELEAKVEELKASGAETNEIIASILEEDYEGTATGELAKYLGVSPVVVGRIRGNIAKARKAEARRMMEGGEGGEEGPSIVQTFKDAIYRVIRRGGPGWKEHLVRLFEKQAHLLRSHDALVAWLTRLGCTGSEAEMVAEELLPSGTGSPGIFGQPGQQAGQPTVAYVPQPGGGYAPIIVMTPPTAAPQWPSGNITFTMPPSPEPKPSFPELNLLREEVKAIKDSFKELSQQMADLTNVVRTPPPPPPPPPSPLPPRIRRRPMLDEEGRVLRDADGNVLYEEIPYDETQAQLEYMRGIAALSRREESGLSAESIRNIINDELSKREVQQEKFTQLQERIMAEIERRFPRVEGVERNITAEEVRKIVKEELEPRTSPEQERKMSELERRIDNILREREQSEETRRLITEQIEPIIKKMEQLEMQTQRATLSGESARLAHAETIADSWQRFFRDMGQSLERGVRAGLLANVVAQMRAANVPDSLIGEVIKAAGGPPEAEFETQRPSGIRERAAEFRRKYLKPEGEA